MPGLTSSVRQYRHNLLQDYMADHGLDALAFTGAEWFEWAGNHPVRELAWERPYLFVITAKQLCFAFLAEQSRHHVEESWDRGSLWISSVYFFSETPAPSDDGWTTPQWPQMVASTFAQLGLADARIGVEAMTSHVSAMAARLPELTVIPLDRSIRELRWVKHEDEIDTMRIAASLSDWAMNAYREELRPGRLLAEIDHVVAARVAIEAAKRLPSADYVLSGLSTLSGQHSACAKGDGAGNGRTLLPDRAAVTTVASRLNGLAMESARTWLIGSPPAEELRLFDSVSEAQDAALGQLVAGNAVASIHEAAQRSLEAHGLGQHLRLRSGHGIGVAMHDFPEDVPFETRPLKAGETYAIEPGIYIRHVGGFRFADTAVVGETEAQRLTQAPKDRRSQTII